MAGKYDSTIQSFDHLSGTQNSPNPQGLPPWSNPRPALLRITREHPARGLTKAPERKSSRQSPDLRPFPGHRQFGVPERPMPVFSDALFKQSAPVRIGGQEVLGRSFPRARLRAERVATGVQPSRRTASRCPAHRCECEQFLATTARPRRLRRPPRKPSERGRVREVTATARTWQTRGGDLTPLAHGCGTQRRASAASPPGPPRNVPTRTDGRPPDSQVPEPAARTVTGRCPHRSRV